MKFWGYQRFHFTGYFWISTEDPAGGVEPVMVMQKEIVFSFSGDPSTPRQVILSQEPLPTASIITGVKDRKGTLIMPEAEWTITSVEPMFDLVGGLSLYRHQAALSKISNFGWPVVRPNL